MIKRDRPADGDNEDAEKIFSGVEGDCNQRRTFAERVLKRARAFLDELEMERSSDQ